MREHPTRLELERLSVDDLPAPLATTTRAHVETCDACGELLSGIELQRERHFAAQPAGVFMDAVEARRARRPRWPLFALFPSLVAGAAALFLLVRPGGSDVRYKGGGIDVLRRSGTTTTQLGPDDRIAAGDELGFVLLRPHAGPVAAWAVDAAGRVDPLTMGAIELAAGDQRLPHSAVVEAPCRDLVLIASDEATWLAADVAALRAGALSASPPPGLVVRHLRCR